MGGKLATDLSSDEAGIANYVLKRNWRRDLDQEIRREGHDYFWPNTASTFAASPLNQPFPNNVTERPKSTETVASITRVGTVATVLFPSGHIFVDGETVSVSGAGEAEYNVTA